MTSTAAPLAPPTTVDVEVGEPELLLKLTGPSGAHLRSLGEEFRVTLGQRGTTLRIHGAAEDVASMERTLVQLLDVLGDRNLSSLELARAARTLRTHPQVNLRRLFDDVVVAAQGRRAIAPKGLTQQLYLQAIRDNDVVFGVGPAGTGKTYLAMAMAVRALQEKRVKRIILTRPAVEAGEKLGFLPGDLAEKINPYLRPLYDALHDMMDAEKVAGLMERGTIEVAPLAFMRGRTLNASFVVLDEAQNTTSEQMKMFLTRLGFDSKAVITGDITQVDLPHSTRSGLRDAEHLLEGIEGIGFVRFNDNDVVRHPLVQRIVRAYDERDARREAARDERRRERGALMDDERERGGGRYRDERRDDDRESLPPRPAAAEPGDAGS
ncbi:MAG: PhoH family protein [Sandaracinaceae bacterium]|nr:PhoH family protein [Sandaracinaceae bacterium]